MQSVGGGGGTGGFSLSAAGAGTGAAAFSLGGSGQGGGAGAAVQLASDGSILTRGADASAIVAQSLGGGGGGGGFSLAASGAGTAAGTISIGGSGGGGGGGGAVTVAACTGFAGNCGSNLDGSSWTLETIGAGARGIFAQSVGGGGGNGGFGIAGSGAGTAAGTFNLGGHGGGGGAGSAVLVDSAASILTNGDASEGIFAQSVGGGGGNGGFSIAGSGAGTAAGTVSLGGYGGDGGAGSTVTVDARSGVVATRGAGSTGILAQSVGGGGGNGSFSIAGTGAGTGAGTLGVGGYGGGGGAGDTVAVTIRAQVVTDGDGADGILAQSVGGGGGRGGFTIAGSGAGTGAGTLGIGGAGGNGGAAGTVNVNAVTGGIATAGFESIGILAQSVGGGGGGGGFSIVGTGAGTGAGTLSIGGFGGGGGDGARVDVSSAIDIGTSGQAAVGILAQSVGGGGGNGAFSIAGSGAGKGAGTLGIGGFGGSGGDAGIVSVTTTAGTIATSGDRAMAVLAQSLGGGGGNGAFSFAGSFAEETAQFSIAVGGSGGLGGFGRDVTVNNAAALATAGAGSAGIFAQSVGGGGGNGGLSVTFGLSVGDSKFNASAAIGGAGGSGNVGGNMTVGNTQRIATTGGDADGIVAQSLGGGGGKGGSSLALNLGLVTSDKPGSSATVDLSIGGTGGAGNVGQSATVTNSGTITTSGDNSRGIFAQSVGGGGGDGGTSRALALSFEKPNPGEVSSATDLELKISVGGNAGTASDGGAVSVANRGDIQTSGAVASGIYAQSVGGGGGVGGEGLSGVNPVVDSIVLLKELTDFFSPTNLSVTVGGNGANSGNGAAVSVSSSGTIRTLGLESDGILAQSVGGGGGVAAITGVAESDQVGAGGKAEVGIAGKVGIGGAAGAAGNGGTVRVVVQGTIDTSGDDAHAIFAQSVGGGGGVAGSVERGLPKLSESQPTLDLGLGLAFGRSGGGGGDGGTVSVTADGTLVTRGAGANGIFAQSVGGGGGLAGERGLGPQNVLPIEFAGSVGAAGSGASVTVVQSGAITTLGAQANGILAQSAGGEGTGGPVSITVNGSITASGAGSHGIYAQSTGGGGAGDITITVAGVVTGGTGAVQEIATDGATRTVPASGVRVEGGSANSLVNRGVVTSVDGVTGTAISASGGTLAVDNFGTVAGLVDLGGGASSFHNEGGAILQAGTTFSLGAAGQFTNDGALSPGGASTVLETAFTGNLRQSAAGSYLVNLDFAANAADRLDVTGVTRLAGHVTVATLNPGQLAPGAHSLVVLSSAGGVEDDGLGLVAPVSAVVRYGLGMPDATDLALSYLVDFAPAGLNRNEAAIGQNFNGIALAGSSTGFTPVLAALAVLPDVRSLATAYDRLSPEPYLATETGTLFSSRAFQHAVQGCGRAAGPAPFATDGTCGWFGVSRAEVRQRDTAASMGFTRSSDLVSGGAEGALADDSWHVGAGFAFEHATMNVDGLAGGSGQQFQVGAVVRKDYGATSLAADLAAGSGSYDVDRQVGLPTPGVTAHGRQDVQFLAADLRLARSIAARPNWYLRPMLDVGVTDIHLPGFDEHGAGVLSLSVAGQDSSFVHVAPNVEFGGEARLANGTVLNPYARAGVIWLVTGIAPVLHASFQGAPAAVPSFTVTGALDRTYADVEVGLTVLSKRGSTVRIGYVGTFSEQLRANAGRLDVSVPF